MGRRKGASYRPDYSSQTQDHNRSSHLRVNNDQDSCQHELRSALQAPDSRTSFSNNNDLPTPVFNPYFSVPTQINTDILPIYGNQVPRPNHGHSIDQFGHRNDANRVISGFMPYESTRFASGVQERQTIQRHSHHTHHQHLNLTNSQALPLRSREAAAPFLARHYSTEVPIPSVERSDPINAARGRPGLEALRQRRQTTPRRTVSPPRAPRATQIYSKQAQLLPGCRNEPQMLLVILDLNGTLLFRPDRTQSEKIKLRPGVDRLLDYLFVHHVPMIYTSARPENAAKMVNGFLTEEQRHKLAAVWARDKLGLSLAQYNEKVQVYKRLEKIWNDDKIQSKCPLQGRWDQTNTILVDDSHIKALAQPHNLLQVPEFKGVASKDKTTLATINAQQELILQSLVVKLETLKWQTDVSRLILRWQTGKAEIPKVPGSGIVVDERVEQKEIAEIRQQMPQGTPETTSSDGGVDLGPTRDRAVPQTQLPVSTQQRDRRVDGKGRDRTESPIPEDTWEKILGEDT